MQMKNNFDSKNLESLAVLVQGSSSPVLRARQPTAKDFNCSKCGMCLIEGYHEECFFGFAIKCFTCKNVEVTPNFDLGEVLPVPVVCLTTGKSYLIGGTVDYDRGSIMTTDQQIADQSAKCTPKAADAPFDISYEFLEVLERRFESLSGVESASRFAELDRYQSSGQTGSFDIPFHWSLRHIRNRIEAYNVEFADPATNVAIGRLYMFHTIDKKWGHHPRYAEICKEFSNSKAFFHTIGQFVVAGYYHENNIPLGFSTRDICGEKKPDLYIRLDAHERFFFEFKTPSSLVWGREAKTRAEVRKNITSILKKNSQINRSRPGAFVFMANHPAYDVHEVLSNELDIFFKRKGRDKSNVAGAIAMQYGPVTAQTGAISNRVTMHFKFARIKNHFCKLSDTMQF